MAGIIAGSVAGWSPIERNYNDSESMGFSRSRARAELESSEEIQIHPGTKSDDPIITENAHNLQAPPSQIEEISAAPAPSVPSLSIPQPRKKSTP
jgi:Ca2+-transporting ATPase